jgi:hypothetical protein
MDLAAVMVRTTTMRMTTTIRRRRRRRRRRTTTTTKKVRSKKRKERGQQLRQRGILRLTECSVKTLVLTLVELMGVQWDRSIRFLHWSFLWYCRA